jgi:hypothetical protein
LRIGAQLTAPERSPSEIANRRPIYVDTTDAVLKAISQAQPGDVITLIPGTYRFRGQSIKVDQPGTKELPVTVRADLPNTVFIEMSTVEGFLVSAPYWSFENLSIRGICKDHGDCEHAFHVVADAHHFAARNNTVVDFNAHFKINRIGLKIPDAGIIEANTLTNTTVRNTTNPVTPIDLVAASEWIIRRNLITDFIKGQSNQTSYGAFSKGAGADTRFEQNVIICENLLKGAPGQRVGLSLGGGGTERAFCRDHRCITEQDRGVIEANLIASCSDDGIYVNRGAASKILHNTLIDTGGISVRFPESSVDAEGNLVDGSIRSRDDGILRKYDNIETSMARIYAGMHPVRMLFAADGATALAWRADPPRRGTGSARMLDLCGDKRPSSPVYGAFEQFSSCVAQGLSR